MTACARAVRDKGGQPVNLGFIPSPAVASYGFGRSIPTLMVTGSHIPDDRNGIKFNLPNGEILKHDEERIRTQTIARPEGLFDAAGLFELGADAGARPSADDRLALGNLAAESFENVGSWFGHRGLRVRERVGLHGFSPSRSTSNGTERGT